MNEFVCIRWNTSGCTIVYYVHTYVVGGVADVIGGDVSDGHSSDLIRQRQTHTSADRQGERGRRRSQMGRRKMRDKCKRREGTMAKENKTASL
jgi:hypothetical protein